MTDHQTIKKQQKNPRKNAKKNNGVLSINKKHTENSWKIVENTVNL